MGNIANTVGLVAEIYSRATPLSNQGWDIPSRHMTCPSYLNLPCSLLPNSWSRASTILTEQWVACRHCKQRWFVNFCNQCNHRRRVRRAGRYTPQELFATSWISPAHLSLYYIQTRLSFILESSQSSISRARSSARRHFYSGDRPYVYKQ